jgi:hypothetical protein
LLEIALRKHRLFWSKKIFLSKKSNILQQTKWVLSFEKYKKRHCWCRLFEPTLPEILW